MNLSDNAQKLREVLALRASGWTVSALSIYVCRDRASIRHHLTKYDIQPLTAEVRIKLFRPKPVILRQSSPERYNFEDEPINPGRSYKEYIEDAKKRHPDEKWHSVPMGRKHMSDILVDICL